MAALRLTSITLCPAASAASPSSTAAPRGASYACAVARGLPSLRLASARSRRGDLVRARAAANPAAENYASALCELASESGTLDQTVSDLEKLEKIFSEEAISEFFDNPTVLRTEKAELIDEIVKSSDLQPHVVNFINVVVDNSRAELVPQIVKEFETAYNALTGTEVATVTSVVQLESEDLAQIAQHVQKITGAANVRIKTRTHGEVTTTFNQRFSYANSNVYTTNGTVQVVNQTIDAKSGTFVKDASAVLLSEEVHKLFPLYIYTGTSDQVGDEYSLVSVVKLGVNHKMVSGGKSGFSYHSLRNSQSARGTMRVKKNLVVGGLGKTHQVYKYMGTDGCYFRDVSSSNYTITADKSGDSCSKRSPSSGVKVSLQ